MHRFDNMCSYLHENICSDPEFCLFIKFGSGIMCVAGFKIRYMAVPCTRVTYGLNVT